MSKFVLLVETGADVPAAFAEKYSIQTVPMHVSFGDRTIDDGTFQVEDVFAYYEQTGSLPKTIGCTPDDFEQAFRKVRHEYSDRHILHLAYSAATTCSYQSALLAAEGKEGITSIDTRHVSAGQAIVVLSMARYLETHPDCSLENAVQTVERLSRSCRMGFFPGDLAYLKAGGRVTNAAYLGAKLLTLNPLIEVRDGKLEATKKYRGRMDKVAHKLLEDFSKSQQLDRELLAFVYSSGLSEKIRTEMNKHAVQLGFQEILWIQTGCVVSTHSGPGAFGVCGFTESPF